MDATTFFATPQWLSFASGLKGSLIILGTMSLVTIVQLYVNYWTLQSIQDNVSTLLSSRRWLTIQDRAIALKIMDESSIFQKEITPTGVSTVQIWRATA